MHRSYKLPRRMNFKDYLDRKMMNSPWFSCSRSKRDNTILDLFVHGVCVWRETTPFLGCRFHCAVSMGQLHCNPRKE